MQRKTDENITERPNTEKSHVTAKRLFNITAASCQKNWAKIGPKTSIQSLS